MMNLCVQQESAMKSATIMTELDDIGGAIELSEINIEDLDLSNFGEASEHAPTDSITIDVQLEAAPEVSYQPPRVSHVNIFDPFFQLQIYSSLYALLFFV
jgi:hypothetical protein